MHLGSFTIMILFWQSNCANAQEGCRSKSGRKIRQAILNHLPKQNDSREWKKNQNALNYGNGPGACSTYNESMRLDIIQHLSQDPDLVECQELLDELANNTARILTKKCSASKNRTLFESYDQSLSALSMFLFDFFTAQGINHIQILSPNSSCK